MIRAQAEAAEAKSSGALAVEFLFLGLLKLAEIKAEDFAPASRHKAEIDADISAVGALFKSEGIDTARTRSLLRRAVAGGTRSGESELSACLNDAAARAAGRGAEDVCGQDMLAAILENPTGCDPRSLPAQKPSRRAKKRAGCGGSGADQARSFRRDEPRFSPRAHGAYPPYAGKAAFERTRAGSRGARIHRGHVCRRGFGSVGRKAKAPARHLRIRGPAGCGKDLLSRTGRGGRWRFLSSALICRALPTTSPTWVSWVLKRAIKAQRPGR